MALKYGDQGGKWASITATATKLAHKKLLPKQFQSSFGNLHLAHIDQWPNLDDNTVIVMILLLHKKLPKDRYTAIAKISKAAIV